MRSTKQAVRKYRPLWFVSLIAIVLAVSACGTTPQSEEQDIHHLATINISATAT
jgi:hypothetical protein